VMMMPKRREKEREAPRVETCIFFRKIHDSRDLFCLDKSEKNAFCTLIGIHKR